MTARPPGLRRARLPLLLAALVGLVAAPEPARAGALAAGDEAAATVALVHPGAAERQLGELAAFLDDVGLEDPGVQKLPQQLLRQLGREGSTLVEAGGLAPDGAVALHTLLVDDGIAHVLAAEVREPDALVDVVEELLRRNAPRDGGSDDGAKSASKEGDDGASADDGDELRMERRKRSEGPAITIHPPKADPIHVRIRGDVARIARSEAALDALEAEEADGPRPELTEALPEEGSRSALVVDLAPKKLREALEVDGYGVARIIERMGGVLAVGTGGADFRIHGRMTPDLKPFLKVAKPGAAGGHARRTMARMVGRGSRGWLRWSFDVEEAWRTASDLLGQSVADLVRSIEGRFGFHVERDLVDVFTGDAMVSCRESFADCVLVLGVAEADRAEGTVAKLLEAATRAIPTLQQRTSDHELDGDVRRHRTRLWKEFPQGAPKNHLLRFHWGTRANALVVGATDEAVEQVLTRDLPEDPERPELLRDHGFDRPTSLAGYRFVGEPPSVLRQVLTLLRELLPSTQGLGHLARLADVLVLLNDRIVDVGFTMRIDGRETTLDGRVRPLPPEGSPNHRPELAETWREALKLRYQGRIRSSSRTLMELVREAPDTPWGRKAAAYVLGAGDPAPIMLLSGLWSALGLQDTGSGGELADRPDPCRALQLLACDGEGGAACRLARQGDAEACRRALQEALQREGSD